MNGREFNRTPQRIEVEDLVGQENRESKQTNPIESESDRKVQGFFEAGNILAGVAELDGEDLRYVEANRSLAGFFGQTEEEVAGRSARELGLDEETIARWVQWCRQCLETGQPVRVESPWMYQGKEGWYDTTINRIPDGPSGAPRFAVVIVDITPYKHPEQASRENQARVQPVGGRPFLSGKDSITGISGFPTGSTERMRMEDELRKNERKFSVLFHQAAFAAALSKMPEGIFVDVNDAWVEKFEFTREEALGKTALELGIYPDAETRERLIAQLQAGLPVRGQEARLRMKSGKWRTFLLNIDAMEFDGEQYSLNTTQDITERKQAEEALRESETRFRAMADGTPVIIWVTDAAGRHEFVNRAYREFFGLLPEESLTLDWTSLVHPDDAGGYIDVFMECLREGRPFRAEARVRRPDGQWRWVDSQGQPRISETGEVLGMVGSSLDITERKQAELEREQLLDQLQAHQNLLLAVMEALPIGLAIFDLRGGDVQANKGFESVWGGPRPLANSVDDYAAYKAWWVDTGQPVQPDEWAASHAVRHSETVVGQFLKIQKFDGSYAYVLNSGAPVRDAHDQVLGSVVAVMDVSDRIQAEQALRESESRFRSVLENSLDVAYRRSVITDRYDYISPVVEHVLGFTEAEMLEMGTEEALERTHPDDRARIEQDLADSTETGIGRLEYRFKTKDGRYRWLADYGTVIKDETGQPRYRSGIVRDITEEKLIEKELRSLNLELEQRVAERTQEMLELQRRLMDMVEAERTQLAREIHDGPMQDIYALSYRLALSGKDLSAPKLAEEHTSIQNELIQINHTLRTISQDLLPPTLSEFGLEKSIQAHAANIASANSDLAVHLDLQNDGKLLEDRVNLALFRIYQTSIANVIRHAQAGQVSVRFSQDAENCYLEIEDDGAGFELPQNWIELARRGHMGLVSARERAQSVGGTLDVQTHPGEGTLLRVVVPLGASTGENFPG